MSAHAFDTYSLRASISPIWMSKSTVVPRSRARVLENSSSNAAAGNLAARRDMSTQDCRSYTFDCDAFGFTLIMAGLRGEGHVAGAAQFLSWHVGTAWDARRAPNDTLDNNARG